MVHSYNSADTPVPSVRVELSCAAMGGVFDRFLCAASVDARGRLGDPGGWERGWYRTETEQSAAGAAADGGNVPLVLMELCFEPREVRATASSSSLENPAAPTVVSGADPRGGEDSGSDTLGSIPRDFEFRRSLNNSAAPFFADESVSRSSSLTAGHGPSSSSSRIVVSRPSAAADPHLLRVRSFWTPAWCSVCERILTTGFPRSGFECETCRIRCCPDCQLRADAAVPCGSDGARAVVEEAARYAVPSLGQVAAYLAPYQRDGAGAGADPAGTGTGPARDGGAGGGPPSAPPPSVRSGVGTLTVSVRSACVFDDPVPSDAEPGVVFGKTSRGAGGGDHYVRISSRRGRAAATAATGEVPSRRTKTVMQVRRKPRGASAFF